MNHIGLVNVCPINNIWRWSARPLRRETTATRALMKWMTQIMPFCPAHCCLHSFIRLLITHADYVWGRLLSPVSTTRVDGWPVSITHWRIDEHVFSLAELTGRVDGPSTRLVNSGSGNRALVFVCLIVCLFVCPQHNSKRIIPKCSNLI